MLNLLKGMGKAFKEAQKAKKLDKAARDKLPPEVGGPARDPDTIKLNKQIKTAKIMQALQFVVQIHFSVIFAVAEMLIL